MVPSSMSLQPSQLNTNIQRQQTVPTCIQSTLMPYSSTSHLPAPCISKPNNSISVIPRPSDLPKRTVFSPASSSNLSSTLNEVQKNIEMMQAMYTQSSTTQPQLRMTSSISSHSLTPTSSTAAFHDTSKMDQQNKEILEKFNLKATNIVSPIHGIAGDIFSSSFKHLDATAAGRNCKATMFDKLNHFNLI